jgi:hypothetical protein
MQLDSYSRVLAPAHTHPQSFHLAGMHYHFTPTGGAVVLVLVVLIVFGGAIAAFVKRA